MVSDNDFLAQLVLGLWQKYMVEEAIHLLEAGKQREKDVSIFLLKVHLQWPNFLPLGPTS
jgi:hypothetical protein